MFPIPPFGKFLGLGLTDRPDTPSRSKQTDDTSAPDKASAHRYRPHRLHALLCLSTFRPNMTSLSSSVIPGVSKRTNFQLDLSRTAIVVVDVQEYLSSSEAENLATDDEEKNSYLYNTSLPRAIGNISRLVNTLRQYRDDTTNGLSTECEVIFTYLESLTDDGRDVSLDYKLSGPKLSQLPGPSNRAKFLSNLRPSTSDGRGDILIPKTSCSVFNSTNIAYVLRNLHVEQIIMVGQLTDQCVESAVRDAADLGFFVTVVDDACAATGVAEHAKGLAGMKGFFRIMKTDELLAEIKFGASNTPSTNGAIGIGDQADCPLEAVGQPQRASHIDSTQMMVVPADQFDVDCESESKATVALLRALRAAAVSFLRYATLDATNSIRCKAIPLSSIRPNADGTLSLDKRVSIAEVCFAMPTYADSISPSCGLSAAGVLLIHPDLGSLRVLPYAKASAMVFGTAHSHLNGSLSPLCTRGLLSRVTSSAKNQFGLQFNCGVEIEFALFKARSNSEAGEPVDTSRFAQSIALNDQQEFISDLVKQLSDQDIEVEMIHAESGPGQFEVVLRYQRDVLQIADNVVFARETIRACAKAHNMRALFLPKIEEGKAGNGQHIHLSFCDLDGHNAFCSNDGGLSLRAKAFIEGILSRLPALLAITTPSVNSFRRMGAGCWTGYDVRWAVEDKEVPIRVCLDNKSRCPSNVEFKLVDGNANVYLGLSAIISSGLEGIAKNLVLRPENGPARGESSCKSLPKTFGESLDLLAKDKFLCEEVLGNKLSTAYIAVRRNEAERSSKATLADEVKEAFAEA